MKKRLARSKKEAITRIYCNQKNNSKRRGHNPPTYSKQDLKDWLYSSEKFHHLFHLWENSNYDPSLRVSIDRVDDSLPYSMGNIQVSTWGENNSKGNCHRKNGTIKSQNKEVEQVFDGVVVATYHSMSEAERQTGIPNSSISQCCNNKCTHAGGYEWKFKIGTTS